MRQPRRPRGRAGGRPLRQRRRTTYILPGAVPAAAAAGVPRLRGDDDDALPAAARGPRLLPALRLPAALAGPGQPLPAPATAAEQIALQQQMLEEDIRSQAALELAGLPLDRRDEVHVPADARGVALRQALCDFATVGSGAAGRLSEAVSPRAARRRTRGSVVGGSSSASRPHAGQTRRSQQAGSPPSSSGASGVPAASVMPPSYPTGCDVSRPSDRATAAEGMLGTVPSRLARRSALTAAAARRPGRLGRRAAWGLPTALGAHRRRLRPLVAGSPALLRRQVPQHASQTPALSPGQHPRRPAAAVARRAARGPARRPDPAGPPRAARRGRRAGGHLARARQRAARDRRPPGAGRPGVGRPRLAVAACSGPTRLHPVPVALDELPQVDAVAHLARPLRPPRPADRRGPARARRRRRSSSRSASASTCAGGACPRTGSSSSTGTSRTTVGGLTLTCTEARHFSGAVFYRDTTLWASWAIAGPRHRVFFGGDTGYTPAFAGIGARLGPVRPDAAADRRLRRRAGTPSTWTPRRPCARTATSAARVLLPIHWATFNLAFHRWAEPVRAPARGRGRADGIAGRRPAARSADRRARPAAARRLVDGGRLAPTPHGDGVHTAGRRAARCCVRGPRPGVLRARVN